MDLKAGEYKVTLSHVTRWWQAGKGPAGYMPRQIDCLYLTDRLWAAPPDVEARRMLREAGKPQGIQWTVNADIGPGEGELWRKWQVRPVSWEERETQPKLFELSRAFWRETVNALAEQGYDEADVPDYRDDRRQVIFDDDWNMMANPVRIRRQVAALQSDIRQVPTPHAYYWLNAGEFDEVTGGWERQGTTLGATYGDFAGEAKHSVTVGQDGQYQVWVRFRNINYFAPWRVTVTSPAGAAAQFDCVERLYPNDGNAQASWQKVGALDMKANEVMAFKIVPLGYRDPGTYRGIYSFLITTDPDYKPAGTVKPAITAEQYLQRAATLGVAASAGYMLWSPPDAYAALSQESWPSDLDQGSQKSVGRAPVARPSSDATPGGAQVPALQMSSASTRAIPLHLRSVSAQPVTLKVDCGPLVGEAGTFAGKVTWRVMSFVPYGTDRQQWSPFVLLRRPSITVPPWNVAGLTLTVDSASVAPGKYTSLVRLTGEGVPERSVTLRVRVSPVKIAAQQPVLVGGWTAPPEGDEYMRDYQAHGMNIGYSPLTKAQMQQWGLKLLALPAWEATVESAKARIGELKALGLDYSDWIFTIRDEPGGKNREELKDYIGPAEAIRAADPQARISFNPGEAGTLATFETLAPLCDFWIPYTIHRTYPPAEAAAKRAIFTVKPWMWYTTPCLWDKSPGLPTQLYDQIRSVPEQPGNCVGTAFFAFNYPFRDHWDTAYEYLPDAAVTVLPSRNGPVATRTWEAIREGTQHADLAMMVREKLGAKAFEDVQDEAMRKLVAQGSVEELLAWLEARP